MFPTLEILFIVPCVALLYDNNSIQLYFTSLTKAFHTFSAFPASNFPLNTTSLYFNVYVLPGSNNQSLSFVGAKLAKTSPRPPFCFLSHILIGSGEL